MNFEVKHLICAGLDVHKKTVVAAVGFQILSLWKQLIK